MISHTENVRLELLEQLRQKVQDTSFSYQGFDFTVTITIGVSSYQSHLSLDEWVRDADEKLYKGKTL